MQTRLFDAKTDFFIKKQEPNAEIMEGEGVTHLFDNVILWEQQGAKGANKAHLDAEKLKIKN